MLLVGSGTVSGNGHARTGRLLRVLYGNYSMVHEDCVARRQIAVGAAVD